MNIINFSLLLALASFVVAYPLREATGEPENTQLGAQAGECPAQIAQKPVIQRSSIRHRHTSGHRWYTSKALALTPILTETLQDVSTTNTIVPTAVPFVRFPQLGAPNMVTAASYNSSLTSKSPASVTSITSYSSSLSSRTVASVISAVSSDRLTTFTRDAFSSLVTAPPRANNTYLTTNTSFQQSSTIPTNTSSNTTTSSPTPSFSGPLRGVNIGNWLVIEPWMDDGTLISGKFRKAPDQWTVDSLDTDGSAIKAHWDTWFTEADVQRLKGYGFNALRIPIGYWAFDNDGTPFRKGAADYMDKAIVWARNASMKVMIDCHGSPGSQNGQMHSGHNGTVDWQKPDNLNLSTRVLQQMIQRWGTIENSDTVFALEIVNEPTANSPNSFSKSQSWASSTYEALQQTISDYGLNKNIQIITHDSFMGIKKFIPYGSKLVSPVNKPTFGVDQHNYQLYTDGDNALDQPGHISKACGWAKDLALTKTSMPVYVGEWSALTNICVDSTGKSYPLSTSAYRSCSTNGTKLWTSEMINQVRRYVEAQLDVFEANSDGHFIWSFKSGGGWGLYNLINVGAFPQPMDDRRYPGQCQ